jgi:crossover junction endodeoxyribonuclease RuvC
MRTPVLSPTCFYLGIDPGKEGVIAILTNDPNIAAVVTTRSVPTIRVPKSRGKGHLVEYALHNFGPMLAPFKGKRVIAGLEYFGSRPGQSSQSVFSIGFGLGVWETALAMSGIPYTRVYPQVWKRALGISVPKEKGKAWDAKAAKAASVQRARQLFPSLDFTLKRDHNKADAVLIAEFMRRTNPL